MQSLYFIIFNSYDFGERRIDKLYRKERGEELSEKELELKSELLISYSIN